ncbi:hypothetical protein [Christiangramia sabulilitoris]|uniref:Uncharacterized protein n=1 Tax=Christiangramia sabulilitoris TaxID=2583991 RepID=A0A550I744_9FLAO|nr:hypothetical protein [Christiangramia sabulilitoris]TRO66790.1 hypothetical protein FGM01_02550 [Christiangramia sabulilitoris]
MKLVHSKFSILALFLLFIVYSCEKESVLESDVEIENSQNSEDNINEPFSGFKIEYKGTVTSANQFIKDDKHLAEFVKQFNSGGTGKSSITSVKYDFEIDTSRVQLIETAHYKSYTFPIFRENSTRDTLENYVLTFYRDGTIRQYKIDYPVIYHQMMNMIFQAPELRLS